MNLAEFPIALMSDRNINNLKTITKKRNIKLSNGYKLEQEWTITGSDAHGLPLAKDDDVLIALLKLGYMNDFDDQNIYFTRYQLIKIIGWEKQGWCFDRIEKSLARLMGTRIYSKKSFWDNADKSYISEGFGIIDSYSIKEKDDLTSNESGEKLYCHVKLSDKLFQSIKSGYVKSINTQIYFNLNSSIAKRLYRYLDKKKHNKKEYSINLITLAEINLGMNMSKRKYRSQIKQRLEKAHEELIKIGFLKEVTYQQNYMTNNCIVTYRFGTNEKIREIEMFTEPIQKESETFLNMVKRGIGQEIARKLINKYGEENINEKIEVFDFLVNTKSQIISKNPIGWLRKSIEDDYIPPKNYITEKKEEEKVQKKKEKEDTIEKIKENLTEEELHQLREEARKICKERFKAILKDKEPFQGMIEGYVNEILMERLKEKEINYN